MKTGSGGEVRGWIGTIYYKYVICECKRRICIRVLYTYWKVLDVDNRSTAFDISFSSLVYVVFLNMNWILQGILYICIYILNMYIYSFNFLYTYICTLYKSTVVSDVLRNSNIEFMTPLRLDYNREPFTKGNGCWEFPEFWWWLISNSCAGKNFWNLRTLYVDDQRRRHATHIHTYKSTKR